jgi:hypothetical protein
MAGHGSMNSWLGHGFVGMNSWFYFLLHAIIPALAATPSPPHAANARATQTRAIGGR